jgi:hypothetical protein
VDSPWSFTGDAGLAGNGSAFTDGNPNAPDGTQVAFVQDTGTIHQEVQFAAGTYKLGFRAAQRGNRQKSFQTLQVRVDGTVVGTFTPSGASYGLYATHRFTVAAGPHTIWFEGLDPNGGDNTVLIDEVSVTVSPSQTFIGSLSPGPAPGSWFGASPTTRGERDEQLSTTIPGIFLGHAAETDPGPALKRVHQENADYKEVQGTQQAMKFTVKRDGQLYLEGEITEHQLADKLDEISLSSFIFPQMEQFSGRAGGTATK